MAIKKNELYSSLWASCDKLRGGMDASQYKDYILTLLFVKYVTDKFKGVKYADLTVPEGGSFDDLVAIKGDKEIGEKMDKIIAKLAEAGNNNLTGVITNAHFNDESKLGKGQEMVDKLTGLIAIFQRPEFDFKNNKAAGDDILGDAYEYLMRNFATESGKSKGQFYTPAEVSRILAKVIGIDKVTDPDTSVYDPACGSGSLLIRAADEAPIEVAIYGQEKEITTAGLAKMNLVLHNKATGEIYAGNTFSDPHYKDDKDDSVLRRFDFAVANPPFSLKNWTDGGKDYGRFTGYGAEPPEKNGDFAWLLHILKSLKSTGKAAVILPHGVLFRGNAEATIRKAIIDNGYIKGIIGLPANLFYGTGIPACIIVIDKSDADERQGIFMIDASHDYVKDGNKNRLRERDIYKIVTTFNEQIGTDPKYARFVPNEEIKVKNNYNLNIPRYIDSSEPEDLQDIDAHLHGGIPAADVDSMEKYWTLFPNLKNKLFSPLRDGYYKLNIKKDDVRSTIYSDEEFNAYADRIDMAFDAWKNKVDEGLRIKKALPGNYSAKGDFVVFVDECHRTQSGKLHAAMKAIIPDSIFIGFTGTPLLKKDKKTSIETFGGYIHTYKFDEAVRDGVVLDLRYEYRDVPQEIKSQEKIDTWFEIKTKGLTPRAKAKLKSMWATMQKVFSSRSRLEKIALDIQFDFETTPRLMDGNGNAMLVAGSVYSACKYYEIFQQIGFKKCAIITSYEPQADDLRTETVSDDEETETFEKYEIYQKMLNGQSVEDFEKEAKRKFIEEPANMKLLIVVDKLLTGFDAPPCTYLYIDKAMHDHGLFQAICRVNRLDDESKDFGYIVDYKQLFGDLANAINTYTSGAFEDYDADDVAGLIKDRTEEARKYFLETLEALDELCEGVTIPRAELDYIHYFCGENGVDLDNDEAFARSREKLYKLVSRLVRAFAEFKPRMDDAGISTADQAKFDERVNTYIKLREVIGRASGDFLDFKQFEPGMRYLIDNYIVSDDAEKIAMFDDFTLLDFILAQEDKLNNDDKTKEQESAAEAIENNIRKKVVQKIVINPAYYSKMSEVLEQLILDRKRGVIAYKQLLAHYLELAKNISTPEENERYPETICKSGAMRAFYDNCGEDEQLAIRLHKAVMTSKMDGFRNNPTKENRIKRALYQILKDDDMVERLYKIVVEQEEY